MEHTKNKGARHRTNLKQEWQQRLKAWRASGDSQLAYCRKHGLSRDSFRYWKKILETSGNSEFVEVSRSRSWSPGGVMEILIDGRVQIRIPQGVSAEHLRAVFRAVKEL